MTFSAVPNELLLDIAQYLPVSSVSLLARTSHTLSHLLTPLLLRLASVDDVAHCIMFDRPISLRSILRSPTIDIDCIMQGMGAGELLSPLHLAARRGAPELVSILLAHGTPVDEPNPDDSRDRTTTLEHAVDSRSLATVTLILEAGANPDRQSTHNRCTPFGRACMNRDDDIANLLIDHGADLESNVLAYAAQAGLNTLLTRLLDLGVPTDVRKRPTSVLQGLCIMCPGGLFQNRMSVLSLEGIYETAEILLSRGADVSKGNGGQNAPLYCVVMAMNVPLAKLLLRFGADANGGPEGNSLVDLARERGSLEMADLLVEYGGRRG